MPPESEGQIVVRGSAVMQGYRNNPEANRGAFRNGWFLTGDLGRLDSEGFLFITGRLKEVINRGGEKIRPAEVEETLAAHPAVAEAAAFGIPHPTLGEDVFAAVVLRPDAAVTHSELRRFAAARLAGFKVPRRIVFAEAIPKGATGKPRRRTLAEQFRATAEPPPFVPPSTPAGEKLADIWKRILDVRQVGIHDDFFDAGGDSFSVNLMLNEVELEFNVDRRSLDASDFFICPTIAALAQIVSDSRVVAGSGHVGERSPFVTLQPNGSRIPFFCFPGADENPYYFRHLARALGPDQPFYAVRDPRPVGERGVYTIEEAAGRLTHALRSIQRRGPYLLGGHCYGGVLAFEIARQLSSYGEEIGLVALFEAPVPGYPKVLRHWRDYCRQAARQLSGLLGGENHISAAEALSHVRLSTRLLGRRTAALTRRALIRVRLKGLIPPLEQVNYLNQRAGRSYQPRELRCKVLQFISAGESHSTVILDDPRLAWREFAGDGFEVYEVPGKADALFVEPNVGQLAAGLRVSLDSINRPSDARKSSAASA